MLAGATIQNRATEPRRRRPVRCRATASGGPCSIVRPFVHRLSASCDINVLPFATQVKQLQTPLQTADPALKLEVIFCVRGVLSPILVNVLLDEIDKELEKRGHAFVRYADDLNVYVRSKRAGERVMEAMRRLYARLKLRINEAKSAVARATERKFLGFSFWIAPGRKIKLRVAAETWKRVKERVRMLTRRVVGQSMAAVCKELGKYLAGWKAYFQIAETPRVFADVDKWVRHRLRALQLKHWKRGPTIYRELRACGMSDHAASRVAGNGRRWWHNSALDLHIALPNKLFDDLGVPRLSA